MRRPFGSLLAAALVALLCVQHAQAQQAAAPPKKTTLAGDVVLWAFTVPPDKVADYEQVLAKLKAALQKLDTPETKQQLAGWKVIKNAQPQGDGTILYIHVITPVKDADYTISQIVYTAFPDPKDQKAFYDLYSTAVKAQFFTIQGQTVAD